MQPAHTRRPSESTSASVHQIASHLEHRSAASARATEGLSAAIAARNFGDNLEAGLMTMSGPSSVRLKPRPQSFLTSSMA